MDTSRRASPARAVAGLLGYMALFGGFLFFPAGTPRWWRGWVLLAVLLAVRAVGSWRLYRLQPALLAERARPPIQRGQPVGDRVLLASTMAAFAALVAFNGADRFHLHLLPSPPAPVTWVGLILFALGWWRASEALVANAFAALVVRHQAERGHVVVDSGPYARVRHPMYGGIVLVMVGMCLWLESTAAVLLATIPIAFLVLRIQVEERFLRRELPGYADYAARVRYRLVPGLW